MHKRLVLSSVVAALSLVALGGAALAAGGGFGSAGSVSFTDLSATAQLTDSSGAFLFINVDRGMQTFKQRGVTGPPAILGPMTVFNYSESSADGTTFLFGCFVIPDSAFTVTSGLAKASLNVDPSIETPCPGLLIPAGAGGRPGLSGITPDAGGGGGGGGTPITANLVWTSNGAVTTNSMTSTSRCQGTVAQAVGTSTNTFAALSGSVSLLADISTQFASISNFSTREVITNSFSAACVGA